MSDAMAHDDAHHGYRPGGMKRWLTTTNHKDIGTLYLVFSLVMFFIGGAMAMIIRLELFQPGLQFINPQFYNSMVTMHALIMIFFLVSTLLYGIFKAFTTTNWVIFYEEINGRDGALPPQNNIEKLINNQELEIRN